MATSSIPAVIDALIATINAQPACALPVVVYDGYPGANPEAQIVSIGGTVAPTEDGRQSWAEMGNLARFEEYDIDCYVSCWVGGDDAQGTTDPTQDAQKIARDQAFTIFHAIESGVRANTNAGGLVLWWEIGPRVTLQQTSPEDRGTGRVAEIQFQVHVKNRI